jgi:hypothetical protein
MPVSTPTLLNPGILASRRIDRSSSNPIVEICLMLPPHGPWHADDRQFQYFIFHISYFIFHISTLLSRFPKIPTALTSKSNQISTKIQSQLSKNTHRQSFHSLSSWITRDIRKGHPGHKFASNCTRPESPSIPLKLSA